MRILPLVMLSLTLAAVPREASAAEPARTGTAPGVDEARRLFNAGALAYGAGKYPAAIQAFEAAYALSKRPGLLFSLAQAHRRQYFIDQDAGHLRAALARYREYLQAEPEGGRRGEVAEALAELEPLVQRLEEGQGVSSPTARVATQLMISSPVADVGIELDGKPLGKLPFISEVTPGPHDVVLVAPGYARYERRVQLREGSVVPLDVELEELPARLSVSAPEGAEIVVDGRSQGFAPISHIELPSGRHFLAVLMNGRRAFAREIELERGATRRVTAELPGTTQRTVAWGLLIGGGALVIAGGATGAVAWVRQGDAEDIRDASERHNIETADARDYQDAVDDRDRFRTVGVAAASAGLGVAAVGVMLLLFDAPDLPQATADGPRVPRRTREQPLEVGVAPGGMRVGVRW